MIFPLGLRGVITTTNPLLSNRSAGVLVPLFSLRSGRNHGIGVIRDLYTFIDWAHEHRLSFIQLLPLSPLSPKAPFPYSAYSAFGLDLSVIALDDVPDVRNSKAAQELLSKQKEQGTLKKLRDAERLDYALVDSVETSNIMKRSLPSFPSSWRKAPPILRKPTERKSIPG